MDTHATFGTQKASTLIDVVIGIYIASIYVLSNQPGFSMASVLLAVLLNALLFFRHLFLTRLSFSSFYRTPWLFLLFAVMSLVWAQQTEPAIDEIAMLFSAVIGGTGIVLAVLNGQSPAAIIAGSLIGSVALVVSNIDTLLRFDLTTRTDALAGNANTLAMCLCFCFLMIWFSPKNSIRRLLPIGYALLLFAVFFSGSRKVGIILMVPIVSVLIRAWVNIGKPSTWAWILLFAALTGITIVGASNLEFVADAVATLRSTQLVKRIEDPKAFGSMSSNETRTDMAWKAMQLWTDAPLLGHGANQFRVKSGFDAYSHNNYSELLANYGIIGLVLYYSIHWLIFQSTLKQSKGSPTRTRSLLLLLAAVLFLDAGMVTYTSKISWMFLAFLMSSTRGRHVPNVMPPPRSPLRGKTNRLAPPDPRPQT